MSAFRDTSYELTYSHRRLNQLGEQMDNTALENSWKWRYATKKYDPTKKLSASDWMMIEKAIQYSPSSYGLQPYQFLRIEKPELREKLKAASWNQTQVTDASHFLVATTKSKITEDDVDRFIHLTAKTRGFPPENMKDYRNMMVNHVVKSFTPDQALSWSRRQVYIAIGFILQTAALLKIDATPMEGLDTNAYDDILGLKSTGYQSVAAVALGYRHPNDDYQKAAKVRFQKDELIQTR